MKKHAGAYLEGCIASELKMGWRVGRIQVCVFRVQSLFELTNSKPTRLALYKPCLPVCRVVPACDRCGADIVNVEIRSDNLQGLLPNCSRHPVPWPCSKSRAHESRRFAQQGHLPRPKEALTREAVFSRGGGLHRHAAPGLTPDVFSRGREVGEGLQSFQPQEFRREKSKQRPSSGDRSFNPCLTAYLRTYEG